MVDYANIYANQSRNYTHFCAWFEIMIWSMCSPGLSQDSSRAENVILSHPVPLWSKRHRDSKHLESSGSTKDRKLSKPQFEAVLQN